MAGLNVVIGLTEPISRSEFPPPFVPRSTINLTFLVPARRLTCEVQGGRGSSRSRSEHGSPSAKKAITERLPVGKALLSSTPDGADNTSVSPTLPGAVASLIRRRTT